MELAVLHALQEHISLVLELILVFLVQQDLHATVRPLFLLVCAMQDIFLLLVLQVALHVQSVHFLLHLVVVVVALVLLVLIPSPQRPLNVLYAMLALILLEVLRLVLHVKQEHMLDLQAV